MDKIGIKLLDSTSHRARPRYSDPHLWVGREGYRAKVVSGEDLNCDAESRPLFHQGLYRTHHAVDLWQPSVGDDKDAGQLLTNEGSAPSSASQFDLVINDAGRLRGR